MNSLSGKTSLFATGPLNRPLFSSIHRMRCTGAIFDIIASCGRSAMLPPAAGPVRVEAEQADRRLGARVVAQPHAPEPARVAKRDFGAVVEHQVQLEESGRPDVRMRPAALGHEPAAALATDFDLAGHPEVKARPGPAIELEPEVLAVTSRRDDAASDQGAAHTGRAHALEHDGVGRAVDVDDPSPDRRAGEQAAGGLDLGKLGHRAVVYDEPRARGAGDGRRARVVPFGPAQAGPAGRGAATNSRSRQWPA